MYLSMLKIKKTNHGFSLLELLIYVAILSVLVVVVSNAFISLSKARLQSQVRGEVHDSLRFAMDKIKLDIKNASSVTNPSSGTDSTLVVVVSGVDITYDVTGGVLRRTEGVNTPIDVTGNNIFVDTFSLTKISNTNLILNETTTAIQINMTIHYNSSNIDLLHSSSFQTTVTLP